MKFWTVSLAAALSSSLAIGCGGTSKPVAPTSVLNADHLTPAEKTEKLLDRIATIRENSTGNSVRALELAFLTKRSGDVAGAERHATYEKEMSNIGAAADALKESIYSHSEYKHPSLEEIRHNEIDHEAIAKQVVELNRRMKAAFEASREKREPAQPQNQ